MFLTKISNSKLFVHVGWIKLKGYFKFLDAGQWKWNTKFASTYRNQE